MKFYVIISILVANTIIPNAFWCYILAANASWKPKRTGEKNFLRVPVVKKTK